jgi:hypothetical protein
MSVRSLYRVLPVAGLLLGVACSGDLTGANKQAVSFSFTSKASTAVGALRTASEVAGAASNLEISNVQVVISKIELDRTGAADCVAEVESSGDDHAQIGEECEDVERDPVLVTLPVDGTLQAAFTVPLSEGTYTELEAKLEPARSDAVAFNSANPGMVGKSIQVTGKFNGVDFTFTSSVRASIEMEFATPLVIDANTKNTTINLNVGKWFLDSAGNAIDPNTQDPALLQQINDNIRRSIHAFEDDDHSGTDDHRGISG